MKARVFIAVAALSLLAACSRQDAQPPSFASTDITGVPWGQGDLQLVDHTGRARRISDFRGKVVLLYFGYTHCPDMCPTALASMAQIRTRLGKDAERVQGLFITVDPTRDTPEVLAQYVPAFDSTFLGLVGSEAVTAAAAADFKVFYAAQKADAQGHYTVDHSGGIYVFDPKGRLRLMMRPDLGVDAMSADVAKLLKEAS